MTSNKINKSTDILYNFGDIRIYANQYAKNIKNDGYIKMPFKTSSGVANPNFIISSKNLKYETTNLYIFKNIHNIKSSESYDGELIIELEPITNSNNKIYVCFLLKNDVDIGKNNTIDSIITQKITNSNILNINNNIIKNDCIANKENTVFIFTSPIHIMSEFDNFKDIIDNREKLFLYSEKNFVPIKASMSESFIGMKNIQEGYVHVGDALDGTIKVDGNTYLECNVNATGDETTEVYTLDLQNDITNKLSENSVLTNTINLIIIIIILAMMIPLIPSMYRFLVIDVLIKGTLGQDNSGSPGSLMTLDYSIFCILLIIYISIMTNGININNITLLSIGLILIILHLISTSIIYFYKKTKPFEYALESSSIVMNYDFFSIFLSTIWNSKLYTILIWMACVFIIGMTGFIIPRADDSSISDDFNINTFVMSSLIYTIPFALVISFLCFRQSPDISP